MLHPAVAVATPWVRLVGAVTRLAQVLGGLAYFLVLIVVALGLWGAVFLFTGFLLAPLMIADVVVLVMFALHTPVLLAGWVDHSMYDVRRGGGAGTAVARVSLTGARIRAP